MDLKNINIFMVQRKEKELLEEVPRVLQESEEVTHWSENAPKSMNLDSEAQEGKMFPSIK